MLNASGAAMKLLLVEDSRVLREKLREMIDAIPYVSVVAETDTEADAMLCVKSCRPDALILDLRLRDGSGLSILECVKAHYPQALVIVLTNHAHAEYRRKCLSLGADYFFDKSHDIEAFNRLLNDLGGRWSPLSGSQVQHPEGPATVAESARSLGTGERDGH